MSYERNYNLLNLKFRELFIPTMLTSIAGNFAILVDAFFISIFMGPMFLSVVQSVEPFVSFINVIYWLIGFGGSILCTIARADFNREKSNEIFSISIIGIVLIAAAITIVSFIFQDTIIHAICRSPTLHQYISQYFNLYIIGIVFECYMAVLAYFIRTDDFIQMQFRTFLIANVANIILDVVFMKFLNLGISGAALATSLGNILAAIYITTYFFNSKATLKIIRVNSSKIAGYLLDICRTGFSTASIPLYITLRLLILNAIVVGVLGDLGLAALNMCYNASFLVEIFILGTSQSILPITAVYYKEKDYNGVKYVINRSFRIVLGFGIFFTALLCIFPQIIMFIFSVNDPAHIPVAMNAIRIFSLSFLGFATNYLYIFYAQSIENDKLANLITLLQGLVFPVVFAASFSYIWAANGFWIGLVVSEFATLLVIFIYSKWINIKSNGQYYGFFINRKSSGREVFESTITGSVEDAVGIAQEVQEFLSEYKHSEIVSMAIEDMVVYIIDINEKVDLIDIIVRDNDDSILISMKYSGKPINIAADYDFESNMFILKRISESIDYSEILGLNNTVITVKK